jgi:enediyne biosynthesis protein E3
VQGARFRTIVHPADVRFSARPTIEIRGAARFDRVVATTFEQAGARTLSATPPRPLLARFLRIDERETDLEVRGFAPADASVRQTLELHGRSFTGGFNEALATREPHALARRLGDVAEAERGFAFEGAAMALALLDVVLLGRKRRLGRFLAGPGAAHVYMLHVGAGWALARLRRRPWAGLPLDPLLRWLVLDGYGFHEAFFHPERVVRRGRRPRRLHTAQLRVFDQGVGRALWFVEAADPDRIAHTIGSLDPARRADLWSGVGLAATYAGAITEDGLGRLAAASGRYRLHAAQGAAFAAGARVRAGNLVPHVDLACELLCGLDARAAADVTDGALCAVRGGEAEDYERWRAEIRALLAAA